LGQIKALTAKLTNLEYQLLLASLEEDIQFLSYAQSVTGSKVKCEKSKINEKDQRLMNTSSSIYIGPVTDCA
jgi:hypothetical protein